MWTSTRPAATALDSVDELAGLRTRYGLPPGLVRLDGNSGGFGRSETSARLHRFAENRWRSGCIGRLDADRKQEVRLTKDRLGGLVGAAPHELAVAETTSVNLFKALIAAARLRPDRPLLGVGRDCFAADLCIARSAAAHTGRELRLLHSLDDLPYDELAVVALAHTDVRTGGVRDAAAITARLHEHDVLALWDLSESAGALDVNLRAWKADFAIGCGHRYLGGGPGAPAYSFVAERHHAALDCEQAREDSASAPSALALCELRAGLSTLDGVSGASLAAKTNGLVSLFVERLRGAPGVEIVSPSADRPRGAQVSLRHPRAERVSQELFARGVVVDLVEPDTLRCSFAPSWLRYVDVWEAAQIVHEVLHDLDHR
ncbi:aminotransferase class V-fold PLP-dependent enzyme [Saccharopolyspora taberi]|uniref:Kynureninase n=1 Tax=Saccharopolyspora taberi TaxID=60895 RepID=A0ABN3VN97_9PSEU